MAESGRLKPTDSVRKTEAGRWVSASSVKGLTFPSAASEPPRRIAHADEGIQREIDPASLAARRSRDYVEPDDPIDDDYDDNDDDDAADDDDLRPRKRRRVKRRDVSGLVIAPAICLLVTAILGVLVNVFQVVISIVAPKWIQQNNIFAQGQQTPPELSVAVGAVFVLLNIAIVGGAISMMKRRMYPLALTSAILSMVNCGNFCCLLGLPFGIWAVVILSRADVRAAFQDADRPRARE
jgi:hypothetical protein